MSVQALTEYMAFMMSVSRFTDMKNILYSLAIWFCISILLFLLVFCVLAFDFKLVVKIFFH